MIDVIIIGIILIIVFFVIRSLIKDKAKGKSGCGCGCSSCAMAGQCSGNKQATDTSHKTADIEQSNRV